MGEGEGERIGKKQVLVRESSHGGGGDVAHTCNTYHCFILGNDTLILLR